MLQSALAFWASMPDLAKGFVISLITILAICVARYLWPMARLGLEFRRFRRWLAKSEFSGATPTNGRLFQAFRAYRSDWKSSATTFGGEERGLVDPSDYFTSGRLFSGLGWAIPQAMPGVFAGVGILGTFLGIVLGLAGINIGGADELFGSVQTLLGGMSTAFVSSIVGIALSLTWLVSHRALHGHVEAELAALRSELRQRFPVWDDGAVLRVSLESQRQQLRDQQAALEHQLKQLELAGDQKAILQNLGTDITEAMDSALKNTLTPALTGLSDSFSALADDIRGQQMEGIGELAEEFRKQLMDSVKADFDRLATGLQGAADLQERTAEQLAGFLDTLAQVSEAQTNLLHATTVASERFSESVAGLAEVHVGIKESVPALSGVAETAARILADVSGQTEVLTEANRELREALATQVDEVQTQVQELSEFGATFSSSLESFQTELRDSIVEFRNVAAERLGEVFSQFDREMAKVVEHLSGTLAELREVSEELPSRVQGLRSSVESLSIPIGALVSAFHDNRESLGDYSAHLEQLNSFLGDSASLERSVGSLERRAVELAQVMRSLEVSVGNGARSPTHESLRPAEAGQDGGVVES